MKRIPQLLFLSVAFLVLAGVSGCPGNGEGYGNTPTDTSGLPLPFEEPSNSVPWPLGAVYVENALNPNCEEGNHQPREIEFHEFPVVTLVDPCLETREPIPLSDVRLSVDRLYVLYQQTFVFELKGHAPDINAGSTNANTNPTE